MLYGESEPHGFSLFSARKSVQSEMEDLVSIIMPSYNAARYTEESIQSVQAQTYTNWELIFVDDNSSDETVRKVMDMQVTDRRIKVFQNPKSGGETISRNAALANAKGRWIAFLNNGDVWEPTKLEKQIRFMEENSYSFSYHQYIETDERTGKSVMMTGPKKIGNYKMRIYCWPGYLTVMYDARKIGAIRIEDVKTEHDYALWLKISRKTDCHLLDECLGKHRNIPGSASDLTRWQRKKALYLLYRKSENLLPPNALLCTLLNIFGRMYKKTVYKKSGELREEEKVKG